MGIYWVYFKDRGNQLKLHIEAETRDKAIALAKKKASRCGLQAWKYDDCQACR